MTIPASNRVDKTEDSQTKDRAHDPKNYRLTQSHLNPLRVAERVDIYERVETNQSDHTQCCSISVSEVLCCFLFEQMVSKFDS